MPNHLESHCPKCGKTNLRAIFTNDIDFVKCDSCSFAIELAIWNVVEISCARVEVERAH